MASQPAIPDLTDTDLAMIFQVLDAYLNTMILQALLLGAYSCILGGTLWYMFHGNDHRYRGFMLFTVLSLYVLAVVDFAFNWSFTRTAFITDGQNFWSVFMAMFGSTSSLRPPHYLVSGITGLISTALADTALIWRCWVVWGHRWLIVLIPILCTITSATIKSIQTYRGLRDMVDSVSQESAQGTSIDLTTVYIAMALTTTLLCTILIVYRIVSIGGARYASGIRTYRGAIEVVVESAALFSASLIVYVALVARNNVADDYLDVIAAAFRGIAPTLMVGRVASGHARPDDSWKETALTATPFGSIRFARSRHENMASTQLTLGAQSGILVDSHSVASENGQKSNV
ncbi:uncharacterized protein BT62DRAFT_1074475 [Guyanagaster necrorhizus]|uniref:Uncharacterized protein n=1 Tax=Guyanagaster necrorhizus TaxID=856835 RepID=A0A9P7VY30_9AGAR|nr:uncharacterized protein BT62DRAFT_1074475 [Guyanagaster necrorhizus MCA 3950]KAG7447941.1 hypothetical protein BT62DRAFT_1074475 [Guyanagaster necrorhizus MCA 3950]